MKRSLVALVFALSTLALAASAQDDGLPGTPITPRSRELARLAAEVAPIETRTVALERNDDRGFEVEKRKVARGRVGAQDVVTKSFELRGPADESGIRPVLSHEKTRWGPGEVDRRVLVGGELERGDVRYRALVGHGSGGPEVRVGLIWRFR